MYMDTFFIFLSLILPVSMDNIKANRETIFKQNSWYNLLFFGTLCTYCHKIRSVKLNFKYVCGGTRVLWTFTPYNWYCMLHINENNVVFFSMTKMLDNCLSSFTSLKSLYDTIALIFCSVSWITVLQPCRWAMQTQTSASCCSPLLLKKKSSGGMWCTKVIMQHFSPQEL